MPMTDEQIKTYKDKNGGKNILLFPTVMGAVVPVYNVTGVTGELNFTRDALAGIFLGKITMWDDPALVKANPGVKLPSEKIVVAHRSDGSGTSFCFTDFLSKGSIGYVELIYAVKNKIPYGKVQNKAGVFMKADLESVSAAAASSKEMPADFRVSITDAPGKAAYPISTFTWLLVPASISDSAKEKAIVGFLKWAITTGQDSVESLDYAKLPKQVAAKEVKQIAMIK
jgi:phosphate transport system substrate-binding protein